eukprot:TRINITY_DN3595_c0_g1_i7.p1 TRINITY_DN3595_c0_g1~~TRINITY_DN3595_c0_g1_i7.p1  ORF type:complete len:933 (-),score=213.16 TRINITY_DN3595_c0_g1_i7:288-3086(-)
MGCASSIQAMMQQVVDVAKEAAEGNLEGALGEVAAEVIGEVAEAIEQQDFGSSGGQSGSSGGNGASYSGGPQMVVIQESPQQQGSSAPLNNTRVVSGPPREIAGGNGRQPDKNYATDAPAPKRSLSLDEIKLEAKQRVDKIVADCAQGNKKFVDTEFPPTTLSLWHNPYDAPDAEEILQPVNWRRLTDMAPAQASVFQASGPKPSDIVQGGIGTCFLISALSVLSAMRPDIIQDIFVASDVSKGVYAVRYWKDGEWKYVVIDDYVPTTMTTLTKRLVPAFAYSPDDVTLWLSLLEKAYAKIHSCYQNIDGGFSNYAMCDWTGGFAMQIHLDDPNSSPLINVGKFTSEKDETYYLSFYNGRIIGGGLSGPKGTMMREFRISGSYNARDFSVKWDYIPVADRFSGPENYRVFQGKFDLANKTINGTWIEDRNRTVSASPIKYEISYTSEPKPVGLSLTQHFASDEERREPTVFDSLFYLIKYSLDKKVLLSSSAHPADAVGFEEKTPEGLLLKHEYSIITAFTIPGTGENVIQLKNPHGKGSEEWNGSWSDNSDKWNNYPDLKNQYVNGDGDEDDGIFCMGFEDWSKKFTHCNMTRIFEPGWNCQTFKGMLLPTNCGMTRNVDKPKYFFKTKGPSTRIVLTLSQPDNKRFENTEDYEIAIGLRVIMELKTLSGGIPGFDSEYNKDDTVVICEVTPAYSRQVSVELSLEEINTGMGQYFRGEGSYYVLPITAETDVVLPYVLNIYSFETTLEVGTMKHINQPPVSDPKSEYAGDLYAKWYYDTYLPEFEPFLDTEFNEDDPKKNQGVRAKGRAELLRAKGRSNMARAKGRSEAARAKGRSDMSRAKGRSEMARAKGRSETSRAKGRSELARAKAPNLAGREPTPADGASPADAKPADAKPADAKPAEAKPAAVKPPTPDPIQDQLEAAFRAQYEL